MHYLHQFCLCLCFSPSPTRRKEAKQCFHDERATWFLRASSCCSFRGDIGAQFETGSGADDEQDKSAADEEEEDDDDETT
ncbi:Protein of unknown function D [Prunus dulcis]|uniref:Uncharacterized protein n=1 Tax=Prunus dulcis TaxID=3755 RepID=A0A4Y1R362_PRUDU|nr:Protein of unknown function D [Prunus dulcis]